MLTRIQKEKIVEDLTNQLKDGKVVVFADYAGTTVTKMQELRNELRSAGVKFKITKKKLFQIALKNSGVEMDVAALPGQIGMAIGSHDEVSAAKLLSKFAKANKNFKVLDGVLENRVISQRDVMALAMLPSKEELLAKLVGSMNAQVSGFVNVLAGNLRNFVGVLRAISESK